MASRISSESPYFRDRRLRLLPIGALDETVALKLIKPDRVKRDKQVYQELRGRSCEELRREMEAFDRAAPAERLHRVGLVRAVGVVFHEAGSEEERVVAREWLRPLLHDPAEKIRRYAMTALPKIGASAEDEATLLALLKTADAREKNSAARVLEKIGGRATLETISAIEFPQTQQKILAALTRAESPGSIKLDGALGQFTGLRIHLNGRAGLEQIVREECEARFRRSRTFRVFDTRAGLVALTPLAPFSLPELYQLRCFDTLGIALPIVANANPLEALAQTIASPTAKRILQTFTDGPIRYRLDFPAKGHQRAAVRDLANRVFALAPELLNSPQQALWTIAIHDQFIELCPKMTPDPRLYYRQGDVPAASHPPLAACMARLAAQGEHETIWDPFCGSGLELIETALLGGVRQIYGTDRDPIAIQIAEKNVAAANLPATRAQFLCADFRDFAKSSGLSRESISVIISNPPLGKRVPIPNLRGLILDLFRASATLLKPGGRLIFVNPFWMESPERTLKLHSRRVVDFGGFDCRLEEYVKAVATQPGLIRRPR